MRILVLAHRIPFPPTTGDKVRAYHVASSLARRHRLTLAFPLDDPTPYEPLTRLAREIPDLEYAHLSPWPRRVAALARMTLGECATLAYFDAPTLHRRIRTRLAARDFDLIYVSGSSMTQYVSDAYDVPIVMDFVDVDSAKWLQYAEHSRLFSAWLYRVEARRLRQHETTVAKRAARCLVTTRHEAALLRQIAPTASISVIPNGVDADHFSPAFSESATGASIVFTGVMSYLPNVDAVTHFGRAIFPLIRERVPSARFVIVGKDPAPAVRRLAAIAGVEVTGAVSDVRPYLRHAAVAVAPLRLGRGIQNKVLEAMATGLPVVASALAHAGVDGVPGRHLLVEDDPVAFADAVVGLLRSRERRDALGRAARAFVQCHHSWSASLARLDAEITEAAATPLNDGIPA